MQAAAEKYISCTVIFQEIPIHAICIGNLAAHIAFSRERHEQAKQWLTTHLGPACNIVQTSNHGFAKLLMDFFEGRLTNFPQPAESPFIENGTWFQKRVWERIAEIPYGETRTYGELAQTLGNPGAARAVGQACNANPLPLIVPCHRVIAASGPGGFAGGYAMKKSLQLLEQQNVPQPQRG